MFIGMPIVCVADSLMFSSQGGTTYDDVGTSSLDTIPISYLRLPRCYCTARDRPRVSVVLTALERVDMGSAGTGVDHFLSALWL